MSAPLTVYTGDKVVIEVIAAGSLPTGKSIVTTPLPTATLVNLDTGLDVTAASITAFGAITVSGTNVYVPIGALAANSFGYRLSVICLVSPADITGEQVEIPPVLVRVPA